MSENFNLLQPEDSALCRSFGLSEAKFLEQIGGLKSYVAGRLDRAEARQLGDVPVLPTTEEEAFQCYTPGLNPDPAHLAAEIWKDQWTKSRGIVQAAKADKQLKDAAAKSKQDDTARVRMEAEYLAKTTYPDWPGDSGQRAMGMSDEQAEEHRQEVESQREACISRAIHEIKSRRHAI
jgi:hypothetical protein